MWAVCPALPERGELPIFPEQEANSTPYQPGPCQPVWCGVCCYLLLYCPFEMKLHTLTRKSNPQLLAQRLLSPPREALPLGGQQLLMVLQEGVRLQWSGSGDEELNTHVQTYTDTRTQVHPDTPYACRHNRHKRTHTNADQHIQTRSKKIKIKTHTQTNVPTCTGTYSNTQIHRCTHD